METGYIYIGDNIFNSLLAISEDEQTKGLMDIPFPPPVMSFIYSTPKINKFWMHRTPSPLDIVFTHNGVVNQLCFGEPFSTKTIGLNYLSDLVIELPYGTVKESNIKIGTKAGFVYPEELSKIIAKKQRENFKIIAGLRYNF